MVFLFCSFSLAQPTAVSTQPSSQPTTKPKATVTQLPANGILKAGETATFKISPGSGATTYRLKRNDGEIIEDKDLPADGVVHGSLGEPGWLTIEFRSPKPAFDKVGFAGAVFSPEDIQTAFKAPDDFDAFWQNQIAESAKLPLNPLLTKGDSEKPGIDYAELTLDNIAGKKTHAHVARPTEGEKFPALVVYQYAGVYEIPKKWAVDRAAKGYLVLVVSAHDMPLNRPKAFYDELNAGALKGYTTFGQTDKQTSYFRPMLVGDYRVLDYVVTRPDWDGKIIAVQGTSQGGMQAIVMAALHPKVSVLMADVPAGCNTLAASLNQRVGWPSWGKYAKPEEVDATMNTSRYFDPVYFAEKVKVPALVCLALRDQTSPPPGVLAMYHRLTGLKEWVINPTAEHHSPQPGFVKRVDEWLKELKTTGSVIVKE